MPNLWSLSQRGITCKTHFSGGNSTNLGMFSLFNGLDAIWFGQPVTYSPLLNRLFRSAGYEVGFFGGRDDWRTFRMDGFIDSQHYDVFETLPYAGLLSDRRATELAIRFLSPDGGIKPSSEPDRKPRLAILYLYGTHAIYHSYVEDQVFAPAADERLPYPYSESMRDQVWNRYKNAARTVDRFIGSVMREDLAMLVVGDHGEAFLEDGTIGHGIRISRQQNMTPAVLATPDTLKRAIHAPTGHIDLLPTLLESEMIRISDPSVFDGKSLLSASDAELQSRVIATCNFLDSSVALIGTWTVTPSFPFAFRAVVSKDLRSQELLNAIDGQGYQLQGEWRDMATEALEQWIASWTPQPSLTSEVVQADARTSAEHQAR
jgi:membrane-anchored protein YejM (alkaline phosphatase superfamily)